MKKWENFEKISKKFRPPSAEGGKTFFNIPKGGGNIRKNGQKIEIGGENKRGGKTSKQGGKNFQTFGGGGENTLFPPFP